MAEAEATRSSSVNYLLGACRSSEVCHL